VVERPISISTPSLTFTTKIIGPLLKSQFLTASDTVALATSTRAMLISFNVQDPQLLTLPLVISSAETVQRIEEYFTYQKFELAKVSIRKSFLQRRFSEKPKNATDQTGSGPRNGNGAATSEPRKRMTSWRFTTVILRNDESAQAFLKLMARAAAPASQSLKATVQSLEIHGATLDFALLSSLSRSLRSLALVDVSGWPAVVEGTKLKGLLPILRELVLRGSTTTGNSLKATSVSELFPKLESIEISSSTDIENGVLDGLNELKRVILSGGARGDLRLSSTKIREVGLLDQREDSLGPVSSTLRGLFFEQKGFRTLSLQRSAFQRLIDVPVSTSVVQTLDLSMSPMLREVNGIENFSGLITLDLSGCSALVELPPTLALPFLIKVNLSRCKALTGIKGLVGCGALTDLNLSHCESLEDSALRTLSECPKLSRLDISHCGLVTTLDDVCPNSLVSLLAIKCSNLQTLPSKAESLLVLDCSGCTWIKSLSPLETLKSLQNLKLHGCGRVESLQPLSSLKRLREIDCSFSTMDGFEDVVKGCASLECVVSNAHEMVESLEIKGDASSILSQIHTLKLNAWKNASDFSKLCVFQTMLSEVEITGSKISTCEAFRGLNQLKSLRLSRSRNLTDVSALSTLPMLADIDLEECSSLVSVDGLATCTELRWLRLNRCDRLEVLGTFDSSRKMKRVEVSGCERSLSSNPQSLRTLFELEYKFRVAVTYSREAMRKWAEKDYEALDKEFEAMRPRRSPGLDLGTVSSATNANEKAACTVS